MLLQGTFVNIGAVIAGCLIGRLAGRYLSTRMRQTLMIGLGLAVLLIGLQLALQSKQLMIVIGGLIFGGLIGEMIGIEKRLEEFGERLQKRFSGMGKVAEGFVTASLLYCVGAMAIMGALQDGLGGPPTILYAKAALDGVASIALTSTLGIGVLFSIIPLLVYQGGITLVAELAETVPQVFVKLLGIRTVFEAKHTVVGKSHDDHVTARMPSPPLIGPQIEHIVQVYIR